MWLAFGTGVAATLAAEFLLAHYFAWSTDKEIAKADAVLQKANTQPWFISTEQFAKKEFGVIENSIEGLFHTTGVVTVANVSSNTANTA